MNPKDRDEKTRTEPQPEHRETPERTVAPPIEREHETQQGALEEDQKRREREQKRRDPERR
jgi:hypothetical protein